MSLMNLSLQTLSYHHPPKQFLGTWGWANKIFVKFVQLITNGDVLKQATVSHAKCCGSFGTMHEQCGSNRSAVQRVQISCTML